ncbi:hypothetical protein GF402_08435 [Candidatus Fermentibacteria bacterium]|nr:hypothetical protein [Candidatus Fermentibacteria bacterium]
MSSGRMSLKVLICAGFALAVSCGGNPVGMPEPEGYEGYIALGWQALAEGNAQEAFDLFTAAIETDVTRAEAYLGAGTACGWLEERWEEADGYLLMALQRDLGHSAVHLHRSEYQVQDTMWTVFRCTDPDLPPDSLEAWLAMTADSGYKWVNSRIYGYLASGGFDTDLSFRFSPAAEDPIACLEVFNTQAWAPFPCDSARGDSIYFTAQYMGSIGWVSVGQYVRYNYASFDAGGDAGQITLDALAVRTVFEDLRVEGNDPLLAAACAQGLLGLAPAYIFGEGDPHRSAAMSLSAAQVAAGAASCAFGQKSFIYSWFLCREAGYGHGLDPESEGFLFALMELISMMQGQE